MDVGWVIIDHIYGRLSNLETLNYPQMLNYLLLSVSDSISTSKSIFLKSSKKIAGHPSCGKISLKALICFLVPFLGFWLVNSERVTKLRLRARQCGKATPGLHLWCFTISHISPDEYAYLIPCPICNLSALR